MNFATMNKIGRLIAAVAVVLAFSTVSKADSVCTTSSTSSCSIDLSVTNFSSGILATGTTYGTVSLTLNNDGTITVDVQMEAGYGLHNADFNWNGGTGDTVSGVFATYGAGNPGLPVFGTGGCGGSCDGFGFFNYGFTGGSGASSNYSEISFTVSQTGGFTAVGQLLADSTSGNHTNPGNWFAGQVVQISSGCTGWVGNAGSTNSGPQAGTGACAGDTQVPEPASIALFGSGLMTLAGMIRKRRKQVK